MINYFEFFGLSESYTIDKKKLRKLYYEKSRKYHPDFFTLEAEKEQEKILDLSTLNNEAYKTLNSDDSRLKHLLQIKGTIVEGEKEKLSQSFLMEMMDLNEAIMDLQFSESNAPQKTHLTENVEKSIRNLEDELLKLGQSELSESVLSKLKELFFRKKYLKRLLDNISNI